MPINQNTALFSLLGTIYGGNGSTTFALPDLRGRFPMHFGNGPGLTPRSLGEQSGQESVTLLQTQMPQHTHPIGASSSPGTTDDPTGAVSARPASSIPTYADTGSAAMDPTAPTGGGQPHENMPPFLALNFQIALVGLYPSRD